MNAMIAVHIEITQSSYSGDRVGDWWMTILRDGATVTETFGPYGECDDAIDALPHALRSIR